MGLDEIWGQGDSRREAQVGSVSNACTTRYEFYSGNSACAFIEELEPMSFTIQDMFVISHDQSPNMQDFVYDDTNDVPPINDIVVDSNSSEHTYYAELTGDEEVVKQAKIELAVIFED